VYDVIVGQWLVIVGLFTPVLWLVTEAVTAPMRESEDSDWDHRDCECEDRDCLACILDGGAR